MKSYLFLYITICISPILLVAQNSNNNLKVFVVKSTISPMFGGDTVEYLKIYGIQNKVISNKINYFLKQSVFLSYESYRFRGEYDEFYNFPITSYLYGRDIIIDSCDANDCASNNQFKIENTQTESRFSGLINAKINKTNNFLILHVSITNSLGFYTNTIKNCKYKNRFEYNFVFNLKNGNNVLWHSLASR